LIIECLVLEIEKDLLLSIDLIFYIEQVESEVLNLIKNRLELGPNIFFRAKRRKTRKDTYSLAISYKKDISVLIKFFLNPTLLLLDGNKND